MTLDIKALAEQVGIREDLHAGKKEWPTGFLEYGTDYADLTRFARAVIEVCAVEMDKLAPLGYAGYGASILRALLPSEPK